MAGPQSDFADCLMNIPIMVSLLIVSPTAVLILENLVLIKMQQGVYSCIVLTLSQ